MTAADIPWWARIDGLLPVPPRWEPPAGSLRAKQGAALRAEWEQQEAEARALRERAEEER